MSKYIPSTHNPKEDVYSKMLKERGLKKREFTAMSYSSKCDLCGETQTHKVKGIKLCDNCFKKI